MNKFFICFFAICFTVTGFAQNNVGIGTASPDPSAVLDLTATTQGFLAPRTRVALVATPVANGLVIFDIDTACYVLYSGGSWHNLCSPHLPPQHPDFNDSVRINPDGTITVIDSAGGNLVTTRQAAWTTLGNSGTNAGTNFAGTTDAQDFVVKSNNAEVIRATTAGAVGINTPAPDATSILDITSTTKGVLFPALTTAQRDAIAGPAVGLTVYNTDLNVHQFWNGTCWVNVGQTVCSFTYNITQNQTSGCLFKSNFGTVADTLTVNLVSGTASPVILSAAGVPAGILVNFSKNYIIPTQTSVMTFTALPSAADGTYTITILAASGSTVQTLTYSLTVYDFAVSLSSMDTTVSLGAAQSGNVFATTTVSIGNNSSCGSNAGNALLSYSVTPTNGPSVSFANSNLPVPGSTTMSISGSCSIAPGIYQITVISQVGVSTSTSTYTVTIQGSAPIHISANTQNVNLFQLAGQPACAVTDTFIVDPGVLVGSDTSTNPAMVTGSFSPGSHIVIINKGTIEGAGGAGGNQTGYGYLASCAGVGDGAMGGDAIDISTAGVVINNLSVIESGGGGGAAGDDLSITPCTLDARGGSGGGGGAGSVGGPGGSGGGNSYPGNPGNPGTAVAGGTGGAQTTWGPCFLSFGTTYHNGNGGNGGAPGQPGIAHGNPGGPGTANFAGSTGVCPYGSPGAPGYSINGGGNTYIFNGNALIGPTHP